MTNKVSPVQWTVTYSSKAARQIRDLPQKVRLQALALQLDIEASGPIRRNWPRFSGLRKSKGTPDEAYHCHLKAGRPTYVACWKIENKSIKIVEIYYVGTHEKAPY